MQVGIDVSSLVYDRGVSRYTANLVRALLQRKELDLALYGSSFRQKKILEFKVNQLLRYKRFNSQSFAKIQSLPPSLLSFFWRFGFNSIKKQLPKIDLFHSWDWLQPPDKKIPLVSTIHDLAILKFKDIAHRQIIEAHQASWRILKNRQAQIIAVSHATKNDIINLLQIPSWQINVIHEALPLEVKMLCESLTEDDYQLIKNRLKLDIPYIFFVGTREPRKNLLRLIEAWRPFKNQMQLIIAGEAGWDETDKYTKSHPNLRFLGKVTDSELVVLYSEAAVFAYPSLYEGFGLPILEAFYHGTPVITSNFSAMVEVAGNAAFLVDPLSIESIRAGIISILNESLSEQQKRLQRMIIRLQMFSWDKVAEETLKVYQKAISNET